MPRYIDADVARRIIDSPRNKEQMLLVLSQAEPADVVEVVHGEWIMLNPSLAKCSACGGYESTNGKDLTMKGIIFREMKLYCPHCGARMDLQ